MPLVTSISDPADHAIAVTPSDGTPITPNASTTALWVGTGGDVAVIMRSGAEVIFTDVPSGSLLPIRITHVKSTGTVTADDMVALYAIG